MNKADAWLGNNAPLSQWGNTEYRGMDTARLIAARPSRIVVSRRDPETGTTIQLAPQIVRIEVLQNPRQSNELHDAIVSTSKQYVVVVGNKDNPAYPDTDLTRADLFFYNGLMWEAVEFINTVPGRLLVSAVATP